MSEKPVLLLTATIHPDPYVTFGRLDPMEREKDYFKATEYYLKIGYKVVFAENSKTKSQMIFDLGRLFPGLEYLFFASQESCLGKSKGEVEIMNFALSQSVLLSKVDYIIKITGRYLILNLDQVVLPTNCIEKDIYINPTRNLRWADSRLMMMKKSYYFQYFLPTVLKYLDEEKNIYMENVFMKSLFQFLIDGGAFSLWPAYPAYQGFDGTHDERVSFNFIKMWKYNMYYRIKKFIFNHRA